MSCQRLTRIMGKRHYGSELGSGVVLAPQHLEMDQVDPTDDAFGLARQWHFETS